MRVRSLWFTTLLLLCHQSLRAQAVASQLPQSQDAQTSTSPANTDAAPPANTDAAPGPPLLFSSPDPAFAPPPIFVPAPLPSTEPQPEKQPAPDPEPAPSEPVEPGIAVVIPAPPVGVPVHIEADTQTKTGDLYTLDGHILVLYKQYIIHADHGTFDNATAQLTANGHLVVDGGPSDEHLVADHGTMNLEQHTGHFYVVTGTLGVRNVTHDRYVFTAPNPFALTGDELLELGPDSYQVIRGAMTSCRLPKPDWRMLGKTIFVENDVARVHNSVFQFFKVPIFFMPYLTHPVDKDQRQSGLLLPLFGNSTQKGFIFGDEYYLTLGRSADLTLGLQYFSARGFSPLGQFRYHGQGEDFIGVRFRALADQLPASQGDDQGGTDIVADARRDLDSHTRAVADVEYLSSYVYRQAFEENFTAAITSEVKSQVYLTHEHDGVVAGARFDRYQNFLSDTSGDEIRVLHLPEFRLDAVDQPVVGFGSHLLFGGEGTIAGLSRSEPGFQTSRFVPRIDLFPHLALPLSGGGWTLRPTVGLRETFYAKSQNPGPPGVVPTQRDASLNRLAFETGVSLRPPTLERDFSMPWVRRLFGGDLRHTLEPEISYRYVTGVGNFPSVLRFDSTDILSNTNEVEYSLTQRLFLRHLHPRPCKGDEALGPSDTCGTKTLDWITWQVAQKHFFNTDFGGAVTPGVRNVLETTLNFTGTTFLTGPRSSSPVISRLRLRTSAATDLEWDLDYDVKTGRIQSSNIFAGYRYHDYSFSVGDSGLRVIGVPAAGATPASTPAAPVSDFNQLRLAAVYGSPVKKGFSAGANVGYDFTLNQVQYLGTQAGYNRDCCGFSFEVRRYSLGSVRDDTQYLFSFTLAGVGSAGSLRPNFRVY
jgi:LPS-assembly protein